MRLEVLDDRIIVHQTGSQNNGIEYDSNKDIHRYKRRTLAYVELFLRENNQLDEADKIKAHLGKILRLSTVPHLIPVGNYKVNVALDYIKITINEDVERGLDLNPDFQRGHVWNMNQRIAFVEFMLQGGKTNPIYFNHETWSRGSGGEFLIVDGKQRLTSILMFLDDEFPVFKELDKDGIGYYCSEFDLVGRYNLEFVVNELPTREQVLQWYLQINKGNIQHSDEEIKRVENMLTELKNKNKGE